MKSRMLNKKVVVGVMTGFLASMILGWDQVTEDVSFETLFPQTWYAKALTAVTHVWADLDVLATERDPHTQLWVIDSSMGRMAFCAYALTHLHEGQPAVVTDDELGYLNRALKSVEMRSAELKDIKDQDRVHCLQRMISGVKKRVKFLLQANDPGSRAS